MKSARRGQVTDGTYIRFVLTGIRRDQKTEHWNVEGREHNVILGEIKWYQAWRRYCFFPDTGTVFEQTCLREIAQFTEEQTQLRRRGVCMESFQPSTGTIV